MARPSNIEELFRPLLAPLVYGAREGFSCLHTLKGLEALIATVADRARKEGAAPELVDRLLAHSRGFDGGDDAKRRLALSSLARDLSQVLTLPAPLASLAGPIDGAQLPLLSPHAAGGMLPPPGRALGGSRAGARAPVEHLQVSRPADTGPRTKRKRTPTTRRAAAAPGRVAEGESEYRTAGHEGASLGIALAEAVKVHGRLAPALKSRRLDRVEDVLFFFPRGYEDRRRPVPIARLRNGERAVAIATVQAVAEVFLSRRRVLRVVLSDGTGSITATWYSYAPWMRRKFAVGQRLAISGEVRTWNGVREIAHPETAPAEEMEADRVNFGRIVPLYAGFERGEQRSFRKLVHSVCEKFSGSVEDPLSKDLLQRAGLPSLPAAVREVHFPERAELPALLAHAAPAQRRLAFDELFFIQLGMALRRRGVKLMPGVRFHVDDAMLSRAAARFPFRLTAAQERVVREIASDMGKPEPMHRLLQGDVGSGKTAVALVSAIVAIENGYQVALMAPTEILAEQHHRNLTQWLGPAGYRTALLSAGIARRKKDESKREAAAGTAQLVVGTHALLQGDVAFDKLGLVIIDEQHRFGVLQRARLMSLGARPDMLVMTATPIPRTLAMTLYGDLEISIIDELPPGRTPIFTRVFPERDRRRVYTLVGSELAKGRQAYVVYPLVEESEKMDLASATAGAAELSKVFPDHRVGLLHGRMKGDEKEAVMREFRSGALRLLVATTVVEVGVDVPGATVIVVESADRFGLSQLHQLRGRVGRGTEKSACYLIGAASHSEEAGRRLSVMERTTNGFAIAEEDLAIRGPGEFLGTRQSGVPGLSMANLSRDHELLILAREEAARIAEEDPRLERAENGPLRRALEERWEGKLGLAQVG
jgi:ATP-dependent DNA helicase RecG